MSSAVLLSLNLMLKLAVTFCGITFEALLPVSIDDIATVVGGKYSVPWSSCSSASGSNIFTNLDRGFSAKWG